MRSIPHIATCVIFLLLCGRASAQDKPLPATNFFPIMIWNHCPPDPAVIAKIKECGFTVAGFVAAKDLPVVQAAGLKAIVSDPRASGYDWRHVDPAVAQQNIRSLVKEVGDNSAVFGYYLIDEPPADFFAGLGQVAAIIKEQAPGKWPYINLFPNYATAGQLQTPDYASYLARFVKTCKPPIVSYDHYALMDDGSLRDGYFQNLQSVREISLKNDVPFWNIVLAVAHFNYAEPTPAGLRFQAYTTLAYGGRGIAYFTYFAPQIGNYRLAPVNAFGDLTPTWFALQDVNKQIQKLAPTLLKLTSQRVYHFAPPAGSPPADSWLSDAGGKQFMAGEFLHADGTQYVMIVNKDRVRSAPVRLTFRTPARRVQIVSPATGQLVPFEGEQVWLAPGQGALLRVER